MRFKLSNIMLMVAMLVAVFSAAIPHHHHNEGMIICSAEDEHECEDDDETFCVSHATYTADVEQMSLQPAALPSHSVCAPQPQEKSFKSEKAHSTPPQILKGERRTCSLRAPPRVIV